MIGTLLDSIDSLERFPHRYPTLPHPKGGGRAIHSMPVRPYLVRYRIEESTKAVKILHVRLGARNT